LIDDGAELGERCALYTSSRNFIQGWMSNPRIPVSARRWKDGPVAVLGGAKIGAGSVILPGLTVDHDAWVASGKLVRRDVAGADSESCPDLARSVSGMFEPCGGFKMRAA
jgi:galactoside O-acetyltransferase